MRAQSTNRDTHSCRRSLSTVKCLPERGPKLIRSSESRPPAALPCWICVLIVSLQHQPKELESHQERLIFSSLFVSFQLRLVSWQGSDVCEGIRCWQLRERQCRVKSMKIHLFDTHWRISGQICVLSIALADKCQQWGAESRAHKYLLMNIREAHSCLHEQVRWVPQSPGTCVAMRMIDQIDIRWLRSKIRQPLEPRCDDGSIQTKNLSAISQTYQSLCPTTITRIWGEKHSSRLQSPNLPEGIQRSTCPNTGTARSAAYSISDAQCMHWCCGSRKWRILISTIRNYIPYIWS